MTFFNISSGFCVKSALTDVHTFSFIYIDYRDGASSKSQEGQEPKNTLKLTLKTGKLHFIAFLHYNFEKSGGSADPSDLPVTTPLFK